MSTPTQVVSNKYMKCMNHDDKAICSYKMLNRCNLQKYQAINQNEKRKGIATGKY